MFLFSSFFLLQHTCSPVDWQGERKSLQRLIYTLEMEIIPFGPFLFSYCFHEDFEQYGQQETQ